MYLSNVLLVGTLENQTESAQIISFSLILPEIDIGFMNRDNFYWLGVATGTDSKTDSAGNGVVMTSDV